MIDATTIAHDPRWLPHALDMQGGRMQFLRVERDILSAPGFLADLKPETAAGDAWLPFVEVAAMKAATGPLHFIFHTAFCRSTLLVRALNIDGLSVGLAEPGIIAQLASAGEAGRALTKPVCDLLSRPWGAGEAVFVKPTNHANMLIPALLAARPDASAVLMTNPLESFLKGVNKRALLGRRWGRHLYLELMSYAGMDLGMDGREQFCLTDLQAAGLAWFLSQRLFTMLRNGPDGARLRTLDGDRFDRDRAATLEAILSLAGLSADPASVQTVLESPLMRRHAKLGGEFTDELSASSAAFVQEVEQVARWIGLIAQQAGVTAPVRQTLF